MSVCRTDRFYASSVFRCPAVACEHKTRRARTGQKVLFVRLLTARPWAERGSCSARGFLTARPWAERGSCSARGLLFFFFAMSES